MLRILKKRHKLLIGIPAQVFTVTPETVLNKITDGIRITKIHAVILIIIQGLLCDRIHHKGRKHQCHPI